MGGMRTARHHHFTGRARRAAPGPLRASLALPPGEDAVLLDAVGKVYEGGAGRPVRALDGVSLGFRAGTFTAVMGPSGSGKSTLLRCAAGLEQPSEGRILLAGTDLGGCGERARTVLRRERIGFVFQSFNLVTSLTAAQNIELPSRFAGRRVGRARVEEALSAVGLSDRATHRPDALSGGQQQRVALARALVTRPAVLFADEPTGALDTGSSREVLRLMRLLVDGEGQTTVMVTHDPWAASVADAVVFLKDGRVADRLDLAGGDRGAGAEAVAARMTRLEGL